MFASNFGRATALALALASVSFATAARADIKDYEFQLVEPQLKTGEAIVALRVVHKPTGKPVPDAVIFSKRLDMAPDNMAGMTAPLEPLPATEPGVYRFRTDLTMAGRWQLSVAAKLQGEDGTLQSRLIVKALP
ncbi:FixH family protein [Blastochloris viridis]|uniref:Capsular polysaccharide biosynthesis/export periplasmic protein WcbA n=1 Tax=Blastochloris viridis TaxID=1079 RepID=A0A0H5BD36_BLAVI|nr:FixH family protein [Blastochloris viridis]ALK10989.1 hypothetical protein BVIR_3232 [Blastochloris viridis]BAR99024.1 Capsular polysaccharide biosynthesis/export periplasmic protein WcbA [Blastochloris viridis]CUU43651.1 hypothetical protein BVIRIDIS_26760 [Blastochloris viridis]